MEWLPSNSITSGSALVILIRVFGMLVYPCHLPHCMLCVSLGISMLRAVSSIWDNRCPMTALRCHATPIMMNSMMFVYEVLQLIPAIIQHWVVTMALAAQVLLKHHTYTQSHVLLTGLGPPGGLGRLTLYPCTCSVPL